MTFFYLLFALHSFKNFVIWIWLHLRHSKEPEPLSPLPTVVERVPVEIWQIIFNHLDDSVELPLSRYPLSSKVAASQVCRKWRHTLFAMGHLWSHVVINVPHTWFINDGTQNSPGHRDSTYLNESLKQWLQNSGSRPIRLSLGYLPGLLFHTVSQHVAKCAGLTELGISSDLETSLSTFSMVLPLAQSTPVRELRVDIQEREAWRVDNIHSIFGARRLESGIFHSGCWVNLQSLYWNCPFAGLPPISAVMPNLRTLSIAGPTNIWDCIAFLGTLYGLTSLSLADLDLQPNATVYQTFFHAGIKSLAITFRTGDPYLYLRYFTLPNLSHLSLTSHSPISIFAQSFENGSFTPTNRSFMELTEFQARSSCTIRSFSICERFPHPDAFSACLTHSSLRKVEYLTIAMEPVGDGTCRGLKDGVLKILQYREGHSAHLRRLKVIELLNLATTDGLLAEVVKSRAHPDPDAMYVPDALEDIHAVYVIEQGDNASDDRPPSYPVDVAMIRRFEREYGIAAHLEEAPFKRPRWRMHQIPIIQDL